MLKILFATSLASIVWYIVLSIIDTKVKNKNSMSSVDKWKSIHTARQKRSFYS